MALCCRPWLNHIVQLDHSNDHTVRAHHAHTSRTHHLRAGGAFSSIALHPLDAVKTKMQADTDDKGKDATTIDVAKQMVKEGGVGALYTGVGIKAVESGLTKATYYWIYTMLGGGKFSSVYTELLVGYVAELPFRSPPAGLVQCVIALPF
jgi:hypothetical protein